MNEKFPEFIFRRKKTVTIEFDGQKMTFTLKAPSAIVQEAAFEEARLAQAEAGERLLAITETIRALCMLQDSELLAETIVEAEHSQISEKAALTLVADGSPDYDDRLAAKIEDFKNKRRSELLVLAKEKLVDILTRYELDKQLEIIWLGAVYSGLLAQVLEDKAGRPLFCSVTEMKSILPLEVLGQLSQALAEFLDERVSAQVFPKPHTLNE